MKQFFRLKGICLFLALMMVFILTACGNAAPDTDSSSQNQWETDSSQSNHESSESATDGSTQSNTTETSTTERGENDTSDTSSTHTSSKNSNTSTNVTDSGTNSSSTTTDTGEKNTSTSTTTSTPRPTVNTDISPIKPENYYGRTWLLSQPNGKTLVQEYDALAVGIENLASEITFNNQLTEQQFYTILNCYRADYPQHFWLANEDHSYSLLEGKVISFLPAYTMNAATKTAEQKKFNDAVNGILSGINKNMTQFEIERTIHDRLILSCTYENSDHAHDAYGALVTKQAVCEGYARAFEHLCRSVGIQTLFVSGMSYNPNSGQQENHAWNIVMIDGQYYHTDPTWDDAGEPKEGEIHYAWFDVTTQQILEDHQLIQEGYAYPNCTATGANYYKQNQMEVSSLTVDNVLGAMKKQGNVYVFHSYVQSMTDPESWFSQHTETLATRLGLNGYSCTIQVTGHDILFTITQPS